MVVEKVDACGKVDGGGRFGFDCLKFDQKLIINKIEY